MEKETDVQVGNERKKSPQTAPRKGALRRGRPPTVDKVKLERELRRYVPKRGGCLRKGLDPSFQKRVDELLRLLGRTEMQWDPSIVVPGMDAPTVAGITYKN
jgi:hypothetical protein